MAKLTQLPSGLWAATKGFNILRLRAKTRTVTLPDGTRAKVTIDDSGTVKHIEHGDHLDAVVRPKPMNYKIVRGEVRARGSR